MVLYDFEFVFPFIFVQTKSIMLRQNKTQQDEDVVAVTREDYVKTLIKARGYTFKAFAREINMPYTTLLSILNGSIGGAAMDNVLKICQALNIRIEELNQLSGENGHVPDAPRSEDGIDSHLLELIRSLPTEKQVALKILLANR